MNIPSTLKSAARSALLGSFALGALGTVAAFAQEAAPAAAAAAPAFTVDKGDTTWMMVSTVLVLLMTVPGLALFYGGLVRSKNMLSVLMQVFTITSVV
ncbi:ammonium transporter, partial [Mesorhizobium sp. M7A.F.Ca.CA.004.04.2.1]